LTRQTEGLGFLALQGVTFELDSDCAYWLDMSAEVVRNKAVPIRHLLAQDFSVHQADPSNNNAFSSSLGRPQKMQILLYYVPNLTNRGADNRTIFLDFIGDLAG
jgi:hypothetical protein